MEQGPHSGERWGTVPLYVELEIGVTVWLLRHCVNLQWERRGVEGRWGIYDDNSVSVHTSAVPANQNESLKPFSHQTGESLQKFELKSQRFQHINVLEGHWPSQHKLQVSKTHFDLKDFPVLPTDEIKLSEVWLSLWLWCSAQGHGRRFSVTAAQLKVEVAMPGAAPELLGQELRAVLPSARVRTTNRVYWQGCF